MIGQVKLSSNANLTIRSEQLVKVSDIKIGKETWVRGVCFDSNFDNFYQTLIKIRVSNNTIVNNVSVLGDTRVGNPVKTLNPDKKIISINENINEIVCLSDGNLCVKKIKSESIPNTLLHPITIKEAAVDEAGHLFIIVDQKMLFYIASIEPQKNKRKSWIYRTV